ncbi:MAG: hypothetical protein GEU90_00665 [Gemmatimonas sp.]|nr:hypothetical protein [Gemmatimonas sp.]
MKTDVSSELHRARSHLGLAAEAIEIAIKELADPYLTPMASTLANVQRAEKAVRNTLLVRRGGRR